MKKLTVKDVARLLPPRPKDANKGTFGKILSIAGSKNFPGAAYLCCAACYRTGAGLVTLATTDEVKIIVSKNLPEVTFLSYEEILEKISGYDALLIGPGLGQSSEAVEIIKKLIKIDLPPVLVDGDGLNILSHIENWWRILKGEIVLTPHPGEMSRLTSLSIDEIQANREKVAEDFSQKWGTVIVLKRANTMIAFPAGEVRISPFANPLLATAGTGDVLSGIIAGLVAQGLQTFDAACLGVYIHGLAAKMLEKEIGQAGALAGDLLPLIPRALLDISEHRVG